MILFHTLLSIGILVGIADGVQRELGRRDELVAARDELWRKYRL